MHATLIGDDGHLCWSDVPDPVISDNQVLLKIYAAGVNRADLLQRAGQYPAPPGWPDWFGLEASGIIEKVGADVAAHGKWKVGDRVCALLGGGGYAEYAAVPEELLMPVPKGLSFTEAAALPEAFGAAYLFLFHEGHLKAGDTLLMQAGASGVASVVIPIAKAFGARVLASVMNDELESKIGYLHADRIINTSKTTLADAFKDELESGHPVDIVIDCLGGDKIGDCFQYMNRLGRWIMIATLAGDTAPVNLRTMYVRGIRLIGTTLRSRTLEQKHEILSEMTKNLWPKVSNREIFPNISRVFSIQDAEKAQDLMASGKNAGKIVLKVREE